MELVNETQTHTKSGNKAQTSKGICKPHNQDHLRAFAPEEEPKVSGWGQAPQLMCTAPEEEPAQPRAKASTNDPTGVESIWYWVFKLNEHSHRV